MMIYLLYIYIYKIINNLKKFITHLYELNFYSNILSMFYFLNIIINGILYPVFPLTNGFHIVKN